MKTIFRFHKALAVLLAAAWCQAVSAQPASCVVAEPLHAVEQFQPLPQRQGTRVQTSGRVPHVQIDIKPVAAINERLHHFAFSLPGVQQRATVVSLPGAIGIWLGEEVAIAKPGAIAAGREFAHIHTDGSLHLPLTYERALEMSEKGWGERHPWADSRDGWEGLVMLYTPLNSEQLKTAAVLIAESYQYVTGQAVGVADC